MDKVSDLFSGAAAEAAIFRDENLIAADPTDTSKRVRLDAGGITTSTTRVLTAQDKDGTIATTTDTISTQYGGTGQDFSATSGLVKLSSGTASAVTAPSGAIVGTSDTQTLTNKTISGSSNTLSNIAKTSITGAPTGDFVGTSDTQTLVSKTLTNPTLGASYIDMDKMSAPLDPSVGTGRLYVKQVDANNDGLFMKIKQGGSIVEVQIL